MQSASKISGFRPLSDFEREICLRFAAVRRFEKLTQAEVADRLQVSRHQIANIEACRVPLKFWVGMTFCSEFNVNQVWLATGDPPKSPYYEINPSFLAPRPSEDAYFSSVCLGQLRDILTLRKGLISASKFRDSAADFLADAYQEVFGELLKVVLLEVPVKARLRYIEFLVKGTRRFIAKLPKALLEDQSPPALFPVQVDEDSPPKKKSKLGVDASAASGMLHGMSSETGYWKALVKDIGALTAAQGAKANLARKFKVTRQAVNKWLSGKGAPSAELTLRLFHWAEQAKAQPKQNPGGALTPTGQKTQVRKSGYEKQTQVRKKQ